MLRTKNHCPESKKLEQIQEENQRRSRERKSGEEQLGGGPSSTDDTKALFSRFVLVFLNLADARNFPKIFQ